MSLSEIMKKVEKSHLVDSVPEFSPGDTILVSMKIREGDKERVQPFQGVVISRRGAGMGRSVTVRKSSGSVYVERVFPVHSPLISEIQLVKKGSVRRAKLFYLRKRTGKATRIREKQ